MRRALILLNPYGHEAVRHKLKNGQKTPKMHFLTVFELMVFCGFSSGQLGKIQNELNFRASQRNQNISPLVKVSKRK